MLRSACTRRYLSRGLLSRSSSRASPHGCLSGPSPAAAAAAGGGSSGFSSYLGRRVGLVQRRHDSSSSSSGSAAAEVPKAATAVSGSEISQAWLALRYHHPWYTVYVPGTAVVVACELPPFYKITTNTSAVSY